MQKELGKQTCTTANKLTSLNVHALKEGNNDKSGMNLSAFRACILKWPATTIFIS